jgi:hypothetical protein
MAEVNCLADAAIRPVLIIIQRLRITHGCQELENMDNYYALVGEMIALMQSSDSINGKLNVLSGLNNSYLFNSTTRGDNWLMW